MVSSYEQRWTELWARWEKRVLIRNETHMTTVVREAMSRRLLVRQSSFAKFGSNPILQRYEVMNEEHLAAQRAAGKRFPKTLKLQATILEQHAMHLRTSLGGTMRLTGLPVSEDSRIMSHATCRGRAANSCNLTT